MSEYDRIEERHNSDGDTFRWVVTDTNARYSNYDCESRAKAARRAFARWFGRYVKTRTTWADGDMNRDEIERLRWRLDDMREYVEHAARYLDELEGKDHLAERIKALRRVAGRTPEEAAAFLAKADKMEAEIV